MPIRSKWQALPTEAINPASLNIDKLPAAGIVDLMLNEDRKALAAVQKERDRIAVGADLIAKSLRKGGRVVFVGAGTSGRLGVLESAEMPPTFGTDPLLVQAIMAGGKNAIFRAKEGAEDNYEEGARAINRLNPTKKDVVIGVSASGMTPFVRGALTRGRQAGFARHLRHLRSANRAADVRRPYHRAGGRARGHRRLHPAESGHGHEAGAEHAHHRRHDPDGQDLRQPDGGRPDGIREAARSGPAHPAYRRRPRPGGGRAAAEARALEREGGHRDAEDGPHLHEGAFPPSPLAGSHPRGHRRGHRAAPASALIEG